MSNEVDVLICGAGAAGLTLAIDLARRGVNFQLIDKLAAPFQGSRGKGIQPRTQEVFEDLKFLDRALATGGIYPPQRRYGLDGSYVEQAMTSSENAATPAEPYQFPLMVPQFLTEALMRDRLAELGHTAEFGIELGSLTQDHQGVQAMLRTPEGEHLVHVRYLVGCDGGRSLVRDALDIDFPGKTLGVRAMVADVMLEGLSRDAWHQFKSVDGDQLSICPLAGTALFQLQGPIPLEGEIELSAAALTTRISALTGRSDIVVNSVLWASAYSMNARLADHYRQGAILLAGDAAHVHPPTGGQGLNTSVQDAYNLGWKLAAVLNGASDALLDTYEAERRPIAAEMLGLSTRLLEGFKSGDNRRGREVQQLDLAYPDSLLSVNTGVPMGLTPGSRAPDANVRGAGGCLTRLFHLFQGTHWTLLSAGPIRLTPRAGLRIHCIGPGLEIEDHLGQFQAHYDIAQGAAVLIRPDGYVAGAFSDEDLPTLERYLELPLPPAGACV